MHAWLLALKDETSFHQESQRNQWMKPLNEEYKNESQSRRSWHDIDHTILNKMMTAMATGLFRSMSTSSANRDSVLALRPLLMWPSSTLSKRPAVGTFE